MKIKTLLITAIFISIGLFFQDKVSAASYSFSPSTGSYLQGCINSVDLMIDTQGANSNAGDIIINYNNTEIEILDADLITAGVQIEEGNAYPVYLGNIVNPTTGTIRLTGASFLGSINGSNTFAKIQFRSLGATVSSTFQIDFIGAGPYNSLDSNIADAVTSNDLLSSVTNGSYTFSSGSCFVDRTPPSINNVAPVNAQTGVGSDSLIYVNVSDLGVGVDITTVQLILNGVLYTSDDFTFTGDSSSYQITLDPNESIPQTIASTLIVRASDYSGNSAQRGITFNIPEVIIQTGDTTSPVIVFEDPVNRGEYESVTVVDLTLTDDSNDIDIDSLQIFIDGELYTSSSPELSFSGDGSGYTISILPDTIFGAGGHTLTVFVSDDSGNGSLKTITFFILDSGGGNGEEILCIDRENEEVVPHDEYCIQNINSIVTDDIIKTLVESPQEIAEQISENAIKTTALSMLLFGLLAFDSIPGFLLRGLFGLLGFLGLRKNGEGFGIVYDSITKEPISQAIVRVYDSNKKIIHTDITDLNGVFMLTPEAGEYYISVKKSGYTFPSKIAISSNDPHFSNNYFGAEISLETSVDLSISIPLDKENPSKIKAMMILFRDRFSAVIFYILNVLYVLGAIASVIMLVTAPSLFNLVMLSLYIITFGLNWVLHRTYTPHHGIVKDNNGLPISGVVIGLRDLNDDKVLAKRLTDQNGQYRFIVKSGRYQLELLSKSHKVVYGTDEIVVKRKFNYEINNDIVVEKVITFKK